MSNRRSFQLSTSLDQLPWNVVSDVSLELNAGTVWTNLVPVLLNSGVRENFVEECSQQIGRPGERLLSELGREGHTVHTFIKLMNEARLERPQLALHRKFKAVMIVADKEESEEGGHVLECEALGFPYPQFQWYRDEERIEGAVSRRLLVPRCPTCRLPGTYKCVVWNEVADGASWSSYYRKPWKTFSSEQTSKVFDLAELREEVCAKCVQEKTMARLCSLLSVELDEPKERKLVSEESASECCATDKVALIICNSTKDAWIVDIHCPCYCICFSLESIWFIQIVMP